MSFIKTELFARISLTEIIRVTIQISDICDNGYEEISATYDTFKRIKGNPYKEEQVEFEGKGYVLNSCGNAGSDILKYLPKLAPVLKVNNMDMFGFASYPIQNTIYQCNNNPEFAMNYYRLTADEVKLIPDLNETAVAKLMYKISVERYADEIKEAIAVIEELSGEKYTRKENISHQLENDIVYCITSQVPKKERCWNLLKGEELPIKYSINLF